MDAFAYALKCATADPSKTNAILCLRNLVEGDGMAWDKAMVPLMCAFPLGVTEIARIAETAAQKWGAASCPT